MSERNPYSDLLARHKELRALSARHKDLLERLVNEFSERYRVPKTHRGQLMRLEIENGDARYPTFYIETKGYDNPSRLNVEIKRQLGAPRNHWYII